MSRRILAAVLLLIAAPLAGCSGFTGGGDGTPTADAADFDAEQVAADAAEAMAAAETYRVEANITRTQSTNNQQVTVEVHSAGVFDRAERELRVEQTVRSAGASREQAVYIVDRTLYQRSATFERRFGSSWIELDVSGNFSRTWRAQDTLARQRVLLANATVTAKGTATVRGTKAYVLRVDGNESAYEDLLARRLGVASDVDVTIETLNFTYYVARDDARLLRSTGTMELQLSTPRATLSQTNEMNLTFTDYGAPVDVTLPDGAAVAVNVSNRSA